MDRYLVAVHVGAGYHGKKKESEYKRLMEEACYAAGTVLENHGAVPMAVSAAISVLEDSPMTNAGNGSNLNALGAVENDALIVTDRGCVGAVAAAPGLVNPIRVATELAMQSQKVLSCGRVPPMVLAGHGARLWASEQGLQPLVDEKEAARMHVTEQSLLNFQKYSDIVAGRTSEIQQTDSCEVNDTVGCVIVDQYGNSAAGVSSGGIPLKYAGRVGEASIPGAGGWSTRDESKNQIISSSCSVSGVGEKIQKNLIAKHVSDCCIYGSRHGQHESSLSLLILEELDHLMEKEIEPKDCGVLLTRATKSGDDIMVELAASFLNTSSFGLGYRAVVGNGHAYQDYLILRDNQNSSRNLDVGIHWKV